MRSPAAVRPWPLGSRPYSHASTSHPHPDTTPSTRAIAAVVGLDRGRVAIEADDPRPVVVGRLDPEAHVDRDAPAIGPRGELRERLVETAGHEGHRPLGGRVPEAEIDVVDLDLPPA